MGDGIEGILRETCMSTSTAILPGQQGDDNTHPHFTVEEFLDGFYSVKTDF